jgi:membrane protease YdiL (CAAX protease family)
MESRAVVPPPLPQNESLGYRLRWWLHLALIGLYPILVIAIGYFFAPAEGRRGPALPNTWIGLLALAAAELGMFFFVFALAWLSSRASAEQLMLKWRNGLQPFLFGFGYSIVLRVAIGILTLVVLMVFLFSWQAVTGKKSKQELEKKAEEVVNQLKPDIGGLLDVKSLGKDPVSFVLMLTLISFGVAGLREELWRAGVLAAVGVLFPKWYNHVAGKLFFIMLVAVVFGLCHIPQGWGGVVLTGILGMGLGCIMVFHGSTWVAVVAHGFFDATSFLMMYLLKDFLSGKVPGL